MAKSRGRASAPASLAIFLILLVALAAAVLYFGGETGTILERATRASVVFKDFVLDLFHAFGIDLGPYAE